MNRYSPDYIEEHLEEYVEKMYESVKSWRAERNRFIPQPPRIAIRELIEYAIAVARSEAL